MENKNVKVLMKLKDHFDPSFLMLQEIIELCPEELWNEINGGFPFWQQVYHVLYWNHRWMRESYELNFIDEDFGKKVSPHLDDKTPALLTRNEMKAYAVKVKLAIETYFNKLDDVMLFESVKRGANLSYFDVIQGQIRHIQYHVGHCNSILRQKGKKAADWIGYGEKRQ